MTIVTTGEYKQNSVKRGSKNIITILIVLYSICSLPCAAEVGYPLGNTIFELDYGLTYQAAILSGDLKNLPSVGPFYQSDFDILHEEHDQTFAFALFDNPGEDRLRLFTILDEKFKARKYSRGNDLLSITGGLRYQPSSIFGTTILFKLDQSKALDPDYNGIKWRGLAGDLETGALYFKKGGATVTFGRQRLFWGPQPVNLLLSQTAEPLDLFLASYNKGRLRFTFLFARLDASQPNAADSVRFPSATFNDNRYLAGHRLDIRFHRKFRMGFFETSLYGGEGRPPELYYLNPFHFFHSVQLNEQMDDNTIIGMDFTYLPHRGYSIYGQLLVDDFQIDDKAKGDQEPDEIGLMAGLYRAGRIGTFEPEAKLEYVRITNRTYNQRIPRNRYIYHDQLLGHPLGPDADSLSLKLGFRPMRRQLIELELAYTRHGEGSITSVWEEPWTETEGDYSEPFPTGVVEKSLHASVRIAGYLPVSGYLSRHFYLSVQAGWSDVDNHDNISNQSLSEGWLDVSLIWLGSIDFNVGD